MAVLGAGLAGLTAAYQLMKAGIKCEIYEAATRTGGRILTQNKFNSEGMFCELGGELIDTGQHAMLNLARELGLEIDDFLPGDKGLETCHFYFGGNRYFEKEVLRSFAPLARHLRADMAKAFGPNWQERVCNYKNHTKAAVRFDRMSLKGYLDSKRADVDKWVLDLINVAYWGEYGGDTENQSALNLFFLIGVDSETMFQIYSSSDESKRIRGGNSRLIEALHAAIKGRVPLHLEHRLVRIENKANALKLHLKTGARTIEVSTPQSICTVPFSLLREVEGLPQLGLSPVKLRCIRQLAYGLNSKYMLGFTKRLWRDPAGPVRPSTGYIYSDLEPQVFWDTSRAQAGSSGIMTNFMGGSPTLLKKPRRLAETLQALDVLVPGLSKLHDGNAAYFSWGDYPLSKGSYTSPSPGQVTTIVGSAEEPELNGRLFFAGEHVSESNQGYMNGAVESAIHAAKQLVTSRSGSVKTAAEAG